MSELTYVNTHKGRSRSNNPYKQYNSRTIASFVNKFLFVRNKLNYYSGLSLNELAIINRYNRNRNGVSKRELAEEFNVSFDDINLIFRRCRCDFQRFMDEEDHRRRLRELMNNGVSLIQLAKACQLPRHQINDYVRNYMNETSSI